MGNYATPPSRRLAYDRDDTQVLWWNTDVSGVFEATSGEIAILNGEADDVVDFLSGSILSSQADVIGVAFLFSQAVKLLDTKVIIENVTGVPTIDVERSDDSTNGRDGAWTQEAAGIAFDEEYGGVRPKYRVGIANVGGVAAHTAWRFILDPGANSVSSFDIRCIHLYAPEFGPANRLAFWHPTIDQEYDPDIDFDDIARTGTLTKQFRVKNLGATQANNIDLTSQLGVSYDGGQGAYTLLSTDDISYGQTKNIGNLGAGAISSVLYYRCEPTVSAKLSTLSVRITPNVVGGWS